MEFLDFLTPEGLTALGQVILIDLVLAGDNAVVIGLAAAGLPKPLRSKAILAGIAAAAILRIGFALVTVHLLAIKGLLLAGALLLFWVCWKMFTELRAGHGAHDMVDVHPDDAIAGAPGAPARKTLGQAVWQIIIADVSMSLDNVLAVAAAAREHPTVLIIGLTLSVVLMGVAASYIARLLNRFRWIGWVGLLIIVYVAGKMAYHGVEELMVLWGG
ncbi:MAG: YjbE family putative metal transport protein [Rubellimicrobium sp.]|nr:YjbE family putative metal transport protein [Rubellimicrobium sp.]